MKRDGRKLDHRTLEEIRRMAPWINQRQLSFHLALSRMTASKILDRRLRVGCGLRKGIDALFEMLRTSSNRLDKDTGSLNSFLGWLEANRHSDPLEG